MVDIADLSAAGRWRGGSRIHAPTATAVEAVATTLVSGGALLVEAGTGTGKPLPVIPALLSGARVLISTGTRHLQDQLYYQDLPVVRRALQIPVATALLKGRGNYLLLYRLQAAEQEGRLASPAHVL